jgi:hypothetical protein
MKTRTASHWGYLCVTVFCPCPDIEIEVDPPTAYSTSRRA